MIEKSLEQLRENRLMRKEIEVAAFEDALEEIAMALRTNYLRELHLILDDRCEHTEVMFQLVHLLEGYEPAPQMTALLEALPEMERKAAEWIRILHFRILNDEPSRILYKSLLQRSKPEGRRVALQVLNTIIREEKSPISEYASFVVS